MLSKSIIICGVCGSLALAALSAVGCGASAAGVSEFPKGATIMRLPAVALVARRTTGPIEIDGDLSEADWQAAGKASGFTLVLDSSMETQYPTDVRALYDENNLYLSFRCDEPNVERLFLSARTRDEDLAYDDSVEALIDPVGDGGHHYQFMLTAGNVQGDAKCRLDAVPNTVHTPRGPVETYRGYPDVDPSWDATWSSAVAKGSAEWRAEIAIPFKELGVDPANRRLLRANFTRHRVTATGRRGRAAIRPEDSVWAKPKGEVHTAALFGFLSLADADGKSPVTPKKLEAAVPGLPGLPGVPEADTPPKLVRFEIDPAGASQPLTRFWDSLNLSYLQGEFFDATYAKGYFRQIRGSGGWPRRRRFGRPESRPATEPATTRPGVPTGGSQGADRPRRPGGFGGRRAFDPDRRWRTLDTIKEHGILAVVTLRSRPEGIVYKSIQNPRWGRVAGPPEKEEDYKLIYDAYRKYFQELYGRYGREFFDSLRFEFWNEPDGSDRFFAGTVDDYCKWYDWIAKALKDVSPTGKIGGPAVTGGGFEFTKAFLDHCREGDNPATGGKGAPVDFITFHTYGWRWQLSPMASCDTTNTVARFWHIINDAGFGGTETHVTEWGVEPTGSASGPYFWFRKSHYAPVWTAKLVKDLDDARKTYAHLKPRVDGLSLCIAGLMTRRAPFAGNRTLFVENWVPKPYYNGYVLLNELGPKRLPVSGPDAGRVQCMATRRADGSLAVLVFHFKEYARTSPTEEDITVELAGLPLDGKTVSQMRVDEKTSNSYTAWLAMGSPDEITDEAAVKLKAAAAVHKTPLRPEGGLVKLNMPVNSVAIVLVE